MYKSNFMVALIGLFCLTFSSLMAGTEFPNLPSAGSKAADSVDEAVIIKIALLQAEELWGEVTAGKPIPCTDIEGNLNYYMVPFSFNGDFPPAEELFRARSESKEKANRLLKEFKPEYDDTYYKFDDGIIISQGEDAESIPTFRPDGTISHRLQYQRSQDALKEKMSDEALDTKFGTVVVSASRDNYPIPAAYHYLPPFFVSGVEAKRIAEEKLQASSCHLENIIFLGAGVSYYRFKDNYNDILINCRTLQTFESLDEFKRFFTSGLDKESESISQAELDEINEDIERAWVRVLAEIN